MKVDVQGLKDNRDAWASPPEAVGVEAAPNDDWSASDDAVDAAADAAEAAEVAADAAIEDPAYDRDNWSEADRQKVEALEEAAGNAASAVFDAQEQAVANARKTRSEENTSELQSLMRISSADICLHKITTNM